MELLGLIRTEEEFDEEPGQWTEEAAREMGVSIFRSNLSVSRSSGSVFAISYTSSDPAKAARIANTHASTYAEAQLRNKRDERCRKRYWKRNGRSRTFRRKSS